MPSINDIIEQKEASLVAKKDMAVLVPKELFEDSIAVVEETTVRTLGFINFVDKDAKIMYPLNIPVSISLNAYNSEETSKGKLILYEKGDIIIESLTYIKRVGDVNQFMKYLVGSKINVSNPEDLVKLFMMSASMNGVKLAALPSVIEAIVAELVRWDKDETKSLRLALKDKKVKKTDFKTVSIKEICRLTSVFNAVSFEDIKKSLQSAVVMSRSDSEQIISPVEKVIHY